MTHLPKYCSPPGSSVHGILQGPAAFPPQAAGPLADGMPETGSDGRGHPEGRRLFEKGKWQAGEDGL